MTGMILPKENLKSLGTASAKTKEGIISEVLFNSIGEGAIVIDERGHIARINQVALDILGYELKDLLGKWYPDVIQATEEDGTIIPNIERPITRVFLTGKTVFRKIFFLRKDSAKIPVALTVSPIMLNNKPLGAIELFRDITDEVRLEHAKDEFISIASHQLRTPASIVKQHLGMVIDGFVTDDDAIQRLLTVAYEYNENQLDIINHLLNIAQVEANKVKPNYRETDLHALLKKVIDGQSAEHKAHSILLKSEQDTKDTKVYADPMHLSMVFENLINNAGKYSPPKSTVTVNLLQTPAMVTVRVKDEGVGIDAKDIPKLFNKFSRIESVSSMASGTGLGLYWAKKLVELYGGNIDVTSKVGKGTTFSVQLPKERHA